MKKAVIIVAGGAGSRMGVRLPKQFIPVAGKPVLMWTMEKFHHYDPGINIILVLPSAQLEGWKKLCNTYDFKLEHAIAEGGETRFHSARNGFHLVEENAVTAVHDGVRPMVSLKTIAACFDMAKRKGNAIPCIELIDSVREIDENGSRILPREKLRLVQTPQVFSYQQLKKAYEMNFDPSLTDDASIVEKAGYMINIVEGNRENIKITNREDLLIAEEFLKKNLFV